MIEGEEGVNNHVMAMWLLALTWVTFPHRDGAVGADSGVRWGETEIEQSLNSGGLALTSASQGNLSNAYRIT